MAKFVYIYGLVDPRTDEIKYIGKSREVHKRLYRHINDTVDNKKTRWISELKAEGLRPIAEKFDEVPSDEWEFWESYYISLFKSWGFDLTNQNEAKIGAKHTEESKKRMSELKKKNPTRYWLGKKRDPEMIKKVASKLTGKTQSEETKLKRLKSRYPNKYN